MASNMKELYAQLIAQGMDPTQYMTDDAIAAATGGNPATAWSPITKSKAKTSGFSNAANTAANTAGIAADIASGAGKTKGKFFKSGGAFDKASGKFSDFASNIANPQFDYTKAEGLQGWGKNLGRMYNIGNLAIQGINAAQGLQGMSDTRDRASDLMSDAILSAGNSPTIWYDLNADQRDLLRELQRGDYDNKGDLSDIDLLGVLGDTAMGALTGAPGGITGAVICGLGGLTNSVIGDLQGGADRDVAELEALYQAILESEQYHNQMRKQRAYAGLY